MKPFITPEIASTGKKIFKYQCEGFATKDLRNQLLEHKLLAYSIFKNQSLQETWDLSFIFDSSLTVQFTAACTQAIGWQEVGSLNMMLSHQTIDNTIQKNENIDHISSIEIKGLEKLIYEDDDILVECGLILYGRCNEEIIVSAGVSPGSISVQAPFSIGQRFEPQFPLTICQREEI